MLHILGAIGLGLVWGWLAARLLADARWYARGIALLGSLAQALMIVRLATPQLLIWFAVAAVIVALLCTGWLRALERQQARGSEVRN